jgi:hypothetical protein
VRQTRETERTLRDPDGEDEDSRKERWHPSPQFTRILDPSGDVRMTAGYESRVAEVRMRSDVVMVVGRAEGLASLDHLLMLSNLQ